VSILTVTGSDAALPDAEAAYDRVKHHDGQLLVSVKSVRLLGVVDDHRLLLVDGGEEEDDLPPEKEAEFLAELKRLHDADDNKEAEREYREDLKRIEGGVPPELN
jgi:hypothetical protein